MFLDRNSPFLSAQGQREIEDFSQYPYYSAGWWKDPFRSDGGLTLLADGAALGHSASMKVPPAEGLAVAVLVNGEVPDGFTVELCDLLLRAAGFNAPPASHDIPAAFVPHPAGEDSLWWGSWNGFVKTSTSEIPIRVMLNAGGLSAALGSDSLKHADATVSYGLMESQLSGGLPLSSVAGLPHTIEITLRRSGDLLTGYVSAVAKLGDRPFLMLPFYVSLKRSPGIHSR